MANEIDLDIGTFNLDETNQIAISDIGRKIIKKLQQSDIPKSNHSVIPPAERSAMEIPIKGTIIGTDYDNLRTNLDALHAALESDSEQKLTLDDDRYIMVQYKDYGENIHGESESIRTLASFYFTMIASYPIWQSETLYEDERTPTSGVGYTINNPGNAPTRVKVTITAPAGGISDNCQLANSTTATFKYRGDIAAGESLVVDNMVSQDDQLVENDGDEDWANVEGDFITLNPGDNTIIFTGTAGAIIKLEYRGAWL